MSNKMVSLPGKQQADAQVLVDGQGRVLTPGSVTDSTGVFSFDLTALPKAYTYDGSNNVATVTYGPDRNGRSVRITKTWAAGVLQSESAPVLIGTAAAGLALTGANSGLVGNASGDIIVTVTPAGSYFSPFTFTPNDNIGDGTFQPPSVELSFAAPSAKFKYTPMSEGVRLLSGTCDQGGLVPAALNFTANPTGKASAPAQVTATASGTSVTLAWPLVPAANNGGTPVKNYLVRLSNGSARLRGATAITHTFSDLQPGVEVTGSVAAVTDNGAGNFATSNAVTPANGSQPARPGPPRNVAATAGNGTIIVTFGAPSSDGGAAVTSYTATDSATGDTVSGSSPLNFTGRANGVARTISVVANNSAGSGPAAVSGSVTPSIGPVALTALTHNVVFAGDSYIAGNGPTGLNGSFPLQMQRGNVLNNMAITNTAIAGQTIANLRTNRVAQIDSRYVAGKKNVFITDGGLRNTICAVNSNTTGAQGCAELKLLFNEMLAVHPDWIIIVLGTIATYSQLASGLSVATANTELQNANDILLAEFPTLPGIAGVVNLRENSAFVWLGGNTPSAAQALCYAADLVHPVEEGCALEKTSVENVVRNAAALRVIPTLAPELPVLASYVEQSGAIRIKIAQPTGGGLVESYVVTTVSGAALTDSAAGTNGWDRTISGLPNGVPQQLIITPINTAGNGPALTTAALTPKAVTTQLYNFEADTVGAAPANVTAINGALVVSNTGTNNATKSVYMPAQPADTKAGVFELTNMVPQAADQKLTFKRTCAVAGANDTQFFGIRLQNAFSTVAGMENYRCGYYLRVRATGLVRLYRLDANQFVQIGADQSFTQSAQVNFELSIVEGLFQVRLNGALIFSKMDFTYPDGRNLIRFEVGDASVAYLDDIQLVS